VARQGPDADVALVQAIAQTVGLPGDGKIILLYAHKEIAKKIARIPCSLVYEGR